MQVASASVSHTSTGPQTRAARSSSRCWRRAIISKSASVQTYGSPRASLTARPDLRHPDRPEPLRQGARQRRRPGRLRAGDHDAPAQVRAHGGRQRRPPRRRVGAHRGAGDHPAARPADVLDAPALGQQVAVGLAGEDGVDRLVQQPLHQRDVEVVDVRVVEVDRELVPARDHPRAPGAAHASTRAAAAAGSAPRRAPSTSTVTRSQRSSAKSTSSWCPACGGRNLPRTRP